ncbi:MULTISPECIES: sensor histidine kinase [unclassified Paenibacillus]|uniref:sensor histidine kinase n=1 Tax=unclassified Paenibacillus TaxID=185978 RepID=UPI0024058566|nr:MULTISPECIES: sensor histidine kinase [unclassified Paenibacillus]MDF9840685.1 OmpR family two-component system bacitracin resistance sensor histidine kinase BceS [Paenibacillus sp. PastF-2]MDF9847268.1 OmpR family two-component system bacitracin resistance sensor histidine kinase BceS [Paenibacillus sp. PastM-2]MDF9853839.1 OmpR family two-component system bacitracin resistance sensor histidine kinase BceS [Paenibacillus sp. PastF-1]MDH6478675.1 OmpR family two-component system bacitracin r
MLVRYVISRKSWILLFISLLGVTDLLIVLDQGVSVEPASFIYLNSLYIIVFVVFFLWRYRKETRYLAAVAKLQDFMSDDWFESLPEPDNELDKITGHVLREASSHFKRKLSGVKDAQLIENDFIASWIHEIKTPLTAMKLIMAARQNDPDIRKIETEWLRIHLLVDRQLYMTRLPALESDYVLEQVSLQRLATEEVRELAPWCMEKNLAVIIEGNDATVVTDRKWCRFIVRQLLTNAIKYSPADTSLTFRTNVTEQEKVFLDLIDEGPGIEHHDLPRIFDKGFTGGNGRIHNASTGLGLYLAQTVAAKIGITLQVQSSQPQGTTMRMTFTDSNAFETVRRGQADHIPL